MRRVLMLMLVAGVGVAGCDKKSPTSPTPQTPAVESVTVNGPDTVLLGATATYTATITGSAPSTSCAWSQDAAFVGTVSGGTFTSAGNGVVTIWCEAGGVRGTKRVTVIPNFGGRWSGTYVVTGCSSTGFFALAPNSCDNFSVGRVLPFTAVLTQTGTTVSGSFTLGSITSTQQSGAIVSDGFSMLLTHEGTGSFRIQSRWDVRQPGVNQFVGVVRQNWTTSGFTGEMNVAADIGVVSRTAGVGVGTFNVRTPPSTLGELLGLLRR